MILYIAQKKHKQINDINRRYLVWIHSMKNYSLENVPRKLRTIDIVDLSNY